MSAEVRGSPWTCQQFVGTSVGISTYQQARYQQMPLTDTAVRNAKPSPDGKDIKLSDGGGLFLLVKPNGAKYWRLNYRHLGKQKTLALGVYPTVTLKDAREQREEAKRLLSQDTDPSLHRQQTRAASKEAAANSFEVIAREWLTKRKAELSPGTVSRMESSFEADLFPHIGKRPITEITAAELLVVLRKIEKRGSVETAHRVKQRVGQVFRYAIATQRASSNPVPDLKEALQSVEAESFAHIKDPKRVGDLLRAIEAYEGTAIVKAALRLAPLVFVRPGNLRQAEWKEFDLDAATWRIPGEKMKMKQPHIVPLSSQAVAILRDIKLLTGNHPERQPFVFPSARAGGRPMSDNAILTALRTMGIPKDEMTGHGFRHMASTLLNELGWDADWIEVQLAHSDTTTRGKYNFARYIEGRTQMMQAWADYLDRLRNGAEVIPINRKA
ncbi:MAG: integrase arm-type DNA-binding domain-containing protein [Perlucidibaca sp.]